jgi:hypothetical protein
METTEEETFMPDVYSKLTEAEQQLNEGKVIDGDISLKQIREKYNI